MLKKFYTYFLLMFFISVVSIAQVKIGSNPSVIKGSSILELESTDKVLVITRMTNSQMNAVVDPYAGALVYNKDEECVFMYNGVNWTSLCSLEAKVTTSPTAPTSNNNTGDFWIDNSQNNTTSIWDGSNWIAIDNNPRKGTGAPNSTNAPNPSAGDVYVNQNTGSVYAYNGSQWINNGVNINANNGVLLDADNTVQLGGALIKPTIIETNASNTLAITGLTEGNVEDDEIVSIDRNTGQLKRINSTNLLKEEVVRLTAVDDQLTFNTGFTLRSNDKVNVYRNGVRIEFTIDNNRQITLEPEAKCYEGDEIKIVQFY